MIGFQAVDEAPLCSAPFRIHLNLSHNLSLSHANLAGKIYNFVLSNDLNLVQDGVGARGVSITNTISLNQTIVINGIYNFGLSNVINLVSNESPETEYTVAVSHPLYLTNNVKASYVFGIELCDNIALMHKFGWVIDLSLSNQLTFTLEELDSLFNELNLQHTLTTNMDDIDCLNPFGRTGDKSIQNNLIITQSLDAKMIYACQTEQQLVILNTLAWR